MTWVFLVLGLTVAASIGYLGYELYRFVKWRFFSA